MQLSPLQSRLAASVIATCLLLVLYLLLFTPHFALAAELGTPPTDHDPAAWTYESLDGGDSADAIDPRNPTYEPDFQLFDRSIIGRDAGNSAPINLNDPVRSNISPGDTLGYVLEAASLSDRSTQGPQEAPELRRSVNDSDSPARDDIVARDSPGAEPELLRRDGPTRTVFISANTCNQPFRISPAQTTMDPPQLTLSVSTSSDNTSPGPGQPDEIQDTMVFTEGAVIYNVSTDSDVYFSITAPMVSEKNFDASSIYNYEVAVSTDGYYHYYDDEIDPNLVWVDSDDSSALLRTNNLTSTPDEVIATPPYSLFAENKNNVGINGVRNSYCGLKSMAQIRLLEDGGGQMTIGLKKGTTNLTSQQFYITGLNASSDYSGFLVQVFRNTTEKKRETGVPGGSIVYKAVDFPTKPNGACTFIFNLTLCDEMQYAVPGNSAKFPNGSALAAFYEDYTQTMYGFFDKVLQQTPCEAEQTEQYSLVKNCDDCRNAYKNWLCSVAIPRCEDFSTPDRQFLQMRNINAAFPNGSHVDEGIRNTNLSTFYPVHGVSNLPLKDLRAFNESRNPKIDSEISPGPYKELLPCLDVCEEVVRSCPASMGFGCPSTENVYSFLGSYGLRNQSEPLACNYPGSAHFRSKATALRARWGLAAGLMGLVLGLATC
ncbi:stretch-activated Ca2+-permeable channel component-domain-containing protein [Xylariomycetidae sp. FL0641]|nr:stretch-activated Ca2+-permeable channel component-domain-containing protein [Xylariomycetidae sp. FL0641]